MSPLCLPILYINKVVKELLKIKTLISGRKGMDQWLFNSDINDGWKIKANSLFATHLISCRESSLFRTHLTCLQSILQRFARIYNFKKDFYVHIRLFLMACRFYTILTSQFAETGADAVE